jgi:hypothetical protein
MSPMNMCLVTIWFKLRLGSLIHLIQIQVICALTLNSITKYQAQPLYETEELFTKTQSRSQCREA